MLNKLKELIGKSFLYKGVEITINDVRFVSTTYVVKTNKRAYNFFENEVETFLSELKNVPIQVKKQELKPTKMENIEKNIVTIQVKKQELKPTKMENIEKNIVTIQQTDLSEILLNTIYKIQTDKEYVQQANAICNVITQMINVKKLEIQLKK
jgi:hypothetical protein